MLLTDIHHPMPVYRDCTLMEVILVSIAALCVWLLICVPLTAMIWGYGCIGWLVALIVWVPSTRLALSRLQQCKVGKPYGYYRHLWLKRFSQSALAPLLPIPYVQRVGRWSVQRKSS